MAVSLNELVAKALALFRTRELDREFDQELQSHLAMLADEHRRRGLTTGEADRQARVELGGLTQLREAHRETRGLPFLESLFLDVRYALRTLRRSPAFTLVAVLTIAIGIGANSAVFSVLHAVLLRPLAYARPQDLALVNTATAQRSKRGRTTYREYEAWKAQSRTFEDLSAYERDSYTLTSGDEPRFVDAANVTANFFAMLGTPPRAGRVPSDEEVSREERLVVISDRMSQRYLRDSASAIGQTLIFSGKTWLVVGIMPARFQFPDPETDLWVPITTTDRWHEPRDHMLDSPRWSLIARVKPGVTLAQAQSEMDTFAARDGKVARVVPLQEAVTATARVAIWVLFGAVTLVSLVACANVANLLLARATAREPEIALRTALGASGARIVRQLITESMALSLLAGLLGVALASAGVRALIAFGPPDIPRLSEATIDPAVLAWTFGLSVAAGVFFGVIPPLRTTARVSSERLKRRRQRAPAILTVAELALAMMLLTGAGLLIRSVRAVEAVDLGFRPEGVLTMSLYVPGSQTRNISFEQAMVDRVSTLPGVLAAGTVGGAGLFSLADNLSVLTLRLDGRPPEPIENRVPIEWSTTSGDYFRAMGIRLLRGRLFDPRDRLHAPLVAIIDEALAQHFWPGEDVIGKRFKGSDPRGVNDDWLTVVGLVNNVSSHGRDREPTPHVYQPQSQSLRQTEDLIVRASNPAAVAASLHGLGRAIEKNAVLSTVSTMEERLGEQISRRRFETWLLTLFAAVALFLATIGTYGLLHYSVTRRTREIGICMALGAARQTVMIRVLRQGVILAGSGLILGVIGALTLGRVLSTLLFAVSPSDPLTLVLVSSLLMFVSLLACFVPAQRAARVDPSIALRCE
jgi:predicted permease